MTVNTLNITSGPYVGNDLTDTFDYTFRIDDESQLSVYEYTTGGHALLVVGTHYTVTSVGNDSGGSVVRIGGPLPGGVTWYIRSNYVENQLTEFSSQGGFFPDIHEKQMDHITFLIQQQIDLLNRTVKLSGSVDLDGDFTIMNNAGERANHYLAFDGAGNLTLASGVDVDIDNDLITLRDDIDNLSNVVGNLPTFEFLKITAPRVLQPSDAGSILVTGGVANSLIRLPPADSAASLEFNFTVAGGLPYYRVAPQPGETLDFGEWPHQIDSYSSLKLVSNGVDTWHRVMNVTVGSVMAMAITPGAPAPAGWFVCDGGAINRSYWPDLFNLIGTTYGPGNGTTTFNLPDLRGEFIRGADLGRGVDVGRVSGTSQLDALQNIVGTVDNIQIDETVVIASSGAIDAVDNGARGNSSIGGAQGIDITFDASNVARTADETRPRNIAMYYCIKY